uniref:ATP synthase subunit a n=1 Tax=Monognathus jesperseni TaxID=556250 RepID=D1YUC8_9TELE|nr:ATPase subunit 6 [Monognathus jesperseni]
MMLNFFDQFASPTHLETPLILIALIMPWLFISSPSARWLHNRALTLQNWLIRQFMHQMFPPMKASGHSWALLFVSLVIFILMLNVMGLMPYTFTPTTQLSLNLGMAIPLWLATIIIGLFNDPNKALGHMLPLGTPPSLIPMLVIIETLSTLIRPIALGVRLTANLTAGHLLIHLISMATMHLMVMPPLAMLTGLALALLTLLEMAVAVIQAYVFVLLLSLYLQENL